MLQAVHVLIAQSHVCAVFSAETFVSMGQNISTNLKINIKG